MMLIPNDLDFKLKTVTDKKLLDSIDLTNIDKPGLHILE
jgi:hypothetical protein